ncbi:hypothetical protein CCH79_00009139 [Gambusia affinis]|uniref:Uncharacterized protein n=1 Tax=Gambusia affinis TaxID=33528 RepID=A0A315W4W6_GAMAF|nr:hypothetical protein CCH79_00009139 [Gambusia affinis]
MNGSAAFNLRSFSNTSRFHQDYPRRRRRGCGHFTGLLWVLTHSTHSIVSDFPEDQLLVAVFPGVPTAAELFLLPNKNQSEGKKKSEEELEKASSIIVSALNQNLVEFELKPGVRVIVYNTQLTLAPLVDSSPRHSSSAMLMLLSVVFLGLAVFLIYKFKRKIPWINIYAEVNQEKEQEMIGSVGQGDSTPKITLSEFTASKELMEKELDARVKTGKVVDLRKFAGRLDESKTQLLSCFLGLDGQRLLKGRKRGERATESRTRLENEDVKLVKKIILGQMGRDYIQISPQSKRTNHEIFY